MCTTCGCSEGARARLTTFAEPPPGEGNAGSHRGFVHRHRADPGHHHGSHDPTAHEYHSHDHADHEHHDHDAHDHHSHDHTGRELPSHGHDHPGHEDHGHHHRDRDDPGHRDRAGPAPSHLVPGSDPERTARTLRIEADILARNRRTAERNRAWLEGRRIAAWNLMSSPGAGKTTLLERTVGDLADEIAVSVIEGDQATLRDAERIRATGCPVVQINTGTGCHLDAEMIEGALRTLDPPPDSLLLIENVGNLVCPALFDLGEGAKIAIMSVTEGEDKPLKYPHMFRESQLMLLTKVDLLPHLDFDVAQCRAHARRVNPRLEILELSTRSGLGLAAWYDLLRRQPFRAAPVSPP